MLTHQALFAALFVLFPSLLVVDAASAPPGSSNLRVGDGTSRSSNINIQGPKLKHPLRVFVLVGQSNMVGHGVIDQRDDDGHQKNATLEWLVANVPDQYGMLKQKSKQSTRSDTSSASTGKNEDDTEWTVRQDVLMACNHRDDLEPILSTYGNLKASLCGGDRGQYQIGPELGFGWTVGNLNKDQRRDKILLLKIAWGGKSLAVDFRPPSSGGTVGPYYQSVIANVKATLANITGYFPKETRNDGCDGDMTTEYEYNLANLIRDVRVDLGVPNLPVSIGASGMAGYEEGRRQDIVNAQLAVADANKYPEFEGNVASVDTRPYCRDPDPASPSDLGYHWNNNCESYWLVGKSMGLAMVELVLRREGREEEEKQGIRAEAETQMKDDAATSIVSAKIA